MKVRFIILFLIYFIQSEDSPPSTIIWEKVNSSIRSGETLLPTNKMHFIFDENNYLNEEKNNTNMQYLYQMQENLYLYEGILNYIILVDNIDENKEDLKTCAKNVISLISKEFGFSLSNSIIALFSMNTRRIRIQPGDILEKIFDNTASSKMIENMRTYMINQNYYDALVHFIQDVDNYYYRKNPSKVIWAKTLYAIRIGKIIMPFNKAHLIFDENNYIKDENDSSRMFSLYHKQENLYLKNNINNYIFLIENIDESEEILETCAKKIKSSISNSFGFFSLEKSIIALFSIKSNRIVIYPGNDISDMFFQDILNAMISNLRIYMNNKEYYTSIIKLIEDIDYYYNKIYPSNIIWEKFLNATKNGEVIIPMDKNYFLYDENNYIKDENDSTRMQTVNKDQSNLYLYDGIQSYIFLVENIDENEEDLETCTQKLENYISNYFHIALYKSIIALFSINSKKIHIHLGLLLDIKNNTLNLIIEILQQYINNGEYYNATIQLIDALYYYYDLKPDEDDSPTKKSTSVVPYILIILFIILMLVLFYLCRTGRLKISNNVSYSRSYSRSSRSSDGHYSPPRTNSYESIGGDLGGDLGVGGGGESGGGGSGGGGASGGW